jgi:hypothetical protein
MVNGGWLGIDALKKMRCLTMQAINQQMVLMEYTAAEIKQFLKYVWVNAPEAEVTK